MASNEPEYTGREWTPKHFGDRKVAYGSTSLMHEFVGETLIISKLPQDVVIGYSGCSPRFAQYKIEGGEHANDIGQQSEDRCRPDKNDQQVLRRGSQCRRGGQSSEVLKKLARNCNVGIAQAGLGSAIVVLSAPCNCSQGSHAWYPPSARFQAQNSGFIYSEADAVSCSIIQKPKNRLLDRKRRCLMEACKIIAEVLIETAANPATS
jgi:hypothetical protein